MVKSLKTLTQNWTEEEYRSYPAYHHSEIAQYAREGFKCIAHLGEQKESESLTFGSLVDTLITEPDKFDEKFYISTVIFPSDTMKGIIDGLFDSLKLDSLDQITDDVILNAAEGFYANIKSPEKRVAKVRDEGREYYNSLVLGNNKKIITQQQYDDAQRCVEKLKETYEVFQPISPFEENDKEILYQAKFKNDYIKLPIVVMFDAILVDHKNKTIYPYDLKTTGQPEYLFPSSFIKWGYDIQGDMYMYVLEKILKEDEVFKDYKIAPFTFIVINKDSLQPLTWSYPTSSYIISNSASKKLGLKDWKVALTKLNLEKTRTLPLNVTQQQPNDILWALQNNYQDSTGDFLEMTYVDETFN